MTHPWWWPPLPWLRGRIRAYRARWYLWRLRRVLLRKGWTVTKSEDHTAPTAALLAPPGPFPPRTENGAPHTWYEMQQPAMGTGRIQDAEIPRPLPPDAQFEGK